MTNTLSYERGSLGRWAGTVLQETYRLGRQIYRSETGETYEAGHMRLPGLFAIKILHAELAANREAFELFCREADVLSSLRHPHAPQIFDFSVTSDGLPYIVTEHLEGTTLGARLAVHGSLPLLDAARIIDAVASALDAAHVRGIVHAHLNPTNVLLVHDEGQEASGLYVKVLEFGASRLGRTRRSTKGMRVVPAARYLAPEQALDLPEGPDSRTDQYALGAIAYAMLTGRDPFHGDDPATLLYRIIHQDPPPLARFLAGDVAALQEVIDRALAKNQADRFGSAGELARAFAGAVSESLYQPDPAELSFEAAPTTPIVRQPVAPGALMLAPLAAEAQAGTAPDPTSWAPVAPPIVVPPVTRHRAIAVGAAALALMGLVAGARYLHAGHGAFHRLGAALSEVAPPPAIEAEPAEAPPSLPPPAAGAPADDEPSPDPSGGGSLTDLPQPPTPTLAAPPVPAPLPPPHGFLIIAPAEEEPGSVRTVAKH